MKKLLSDSAKHGYVKWLIQEFPITSKLSLKQKDKLQWRLLHWEWTYVCWKKERKKEIKELLVLGNEWIGNGLRRSKGGSRWRWIRRALHGYSCMVSHVMLGTSNSSNSFPNFWVRLCVPMMILGFRLRWMFPDCLWEQDVPNRWMKFWMSSSISSYLTSRWWRTHMVILE